LCDLQWSQVELTTGRLHVRRAKNGSPSVHPMQGDEIRALRRLQREQGPSSHVFMTERDGPSAVLGAGCAEILAGGNGRHWCRRRASRLHRPTFFFAGTFSLRDACALPHAG
jgi:integrase